MEDRSNGRRARERGNWCGSRELVVVVVHVCKVDDGFPQV